MSYNFETSIQITATKAKIWSVLLSPDTYTIWTAPFLPPGMEGASSAIEGDPHKVGNKLYFTDGKGSGMVSLVDQYKKSDHIVFKHIGVLMDKKDVLEGKEVDSWKNSTEGYWTKRPSSGKGWKLQIELTGNEENEMTKWLAGVWPKALAIVKELCEKEEEKKER